MQSLLLTLLLFIGLFSFADYPTKVSHGLSHRNHTADLPTLTFKHAVNPSESVNWPKTYTESFGYKGVTYTADLAYKTYVKRGSRTSFKDNPNDLEVINTFYGQEYTAKLTDKTWYRSSEPIYVEGQYFAQGGGNGRILTDSRARILNYGSTRKVDPWPGLINGSSRGAYYLATVPYPSHISGYYANKYFYSTTLPESLVATQKIEKNGFYIYVRSINEEERTAVIAITRFGQSRGREFWNATWDIARIIIRNKVSN